VTQPSIEMGSSYTNPPHPRSKHVKFSKLKGYHFHVGERK